MSRATTTSWIVVSLGAVVTAIGMTLDGRFGGGVVGFGLAHIVLGVLDSFRPSVRNG